MGLTTTALALLAAVTVSTSVTSQSTAESAAGVTHIRRYAAQDRPGHAEADHFVTSYRADTTTAADSVRAVIMRYLHGLKFNDTVSFHEAFWPGAYLYFVGRDGQLGQLSQAQWYASFVPSLGHEEPGDLQMTALDLTKDAASVKVVENYPRSRYTDYINLLRIGGRWWIVNKIYTAEPRTR